MYNLFYLILREVAFMVRNICVVTTSSVFAHPRSSSSRNSFRLTLHLAPVSRVADSNSQRFGRTRYRLSHFFFFSSILSRLSFLFASMPLQGVGKNVCRESMSSLSQPLDNRVPRAKKAFRDFRFSVNFRIHTNAFTRRFATFLDR